MNKELNGRFLNKELGGYFLNKGSDRITKIILNLPNIADIPDCPIRSIMSGRKHCSAALLFHKIQNFRHSCLNGNGAYYNISENILYDQVLIWLCPDTQTSPLHQIELLWAFPDTAFCLCPTPQCGRRHPSSGSCHALPAAA